MDWVITYWPLFHMSDMTALAWHVLGRSIHASSRFYRLSRQVKKVLRSALSYAQAASPRDCSFIRIRCGTERRGVPQ